MKSALPWLAVLTFLITLVIPMHAQSYADELNLGVEAYKRSHYEQAIEHFRKATEFDPSKTVAHMYLATAYVSQYIPGVDTPENLQLAEDAIEQYLVVLDGDPSGDSRANAAKGIAYLDLNMKKFDDARTYYLKASSFDPKDPEPYYSVGVIDWTRCYQPRMEARARLGLRPDQNLNGRKPEEKKVCDDLRARNLTTVEDGIETLGKAIALRPDYDDAMAYMNLMYRERADLECDDPAARARDLRTADDWVDHTLATKKAKAEKATAPSPQ